MKRTRKIITLIMLIAILVMSLGINTSNAAVTIANNATNRTVPITRNVTGVTNKVNNTFGYTITPDTTYNGDKTVTNYPTTLSIPFTNVTPTSGTATQTVNLDFAGTTFSAVGDYRFKIKETSSTDENQYPKDTAEYYLYVSVRYADDNGTMVATVATQGIKNSTNDENNGGTKTAVVFTSQAQLTYITISKTVTGNMGDRNKYFEVPVTITGATGETYTVSGGSFQNNPTTVASGTQATIKIKHGETITIGKSGDIKQIPIGADYTVAENAETNYTTQIDAANQSSVSKETVSNPASNHTSIVNNYELSVLTGVFFSIMPYIILALFVLLLLLLVKRSSKRKE